MCKLFSVKVLLTSTDKSDTKAVQKIGLVLYLLIIMKVSFVNKKKFKGNAFLGYI